MREEERRREIKRGEEERRRERRREETRRREKKREEERRRETKRKKPWKVDLKALGRPLKAPKGLLTPCCATCCARDVSTGLLETLKPVSAGNGKRLKFIRIALLRHFKGTKMSQKRETFVKIWPF